MNENETVLMTWERKIMRKKWGKIYHNGYWRTNITQEIYKKVKQSLYWPWEALRIPRGWRSQISWQSIDAGGTVVSPRHRAPLFPRNYSWHSFLFPHPSVPTLGPTQLPVQWVQGVKWPGRDAGYPLHLIPMLKKEWRYVFPIPLVFAACSRANFTFSFTHFR
jgi:hypothetical protein